MISHEYTRISCVSAYTDDITEANPDVTSEFAAAAYRFGHSLVSDKARFTDPTYTEREDVDYTRVSS